MTKYGVEVAALRQGIPAAWRREMEWGVGEMEEGEEAFL